MHSSGFPGDGTRVPFHRNELENLKGIVDKAKRSEIAGSRPQISVAEEHLHNMLVDLDNVVSKVTAGHCLCAVLYASLHSMGLFKKTVTPETPFNSAVGVGGWIMVQFSQ